MVRGSGLTILQTGSVFLSPSPESTSIASELKITLKCVFSDGVMVNSFGSVLSFLLTWTEKDNTAQDKAQIQTQAFAKILMYIQDTALQISVVSPCLKVQTKFYKSRSEPYPGGFWKLPPCPLHVRLSSEHALCRLHHQLGVALGRHGLGHLPAVSKHHISTESAGNDLVGVICFTLPCLF